MATKQKSKRQSNSQRQPVDRIHAAAQANVQRRETAVEVNPDTPDAEVDASEGDEYIPLLDLSTSAPVRPFIRIDGERYEVMLFREFGVADQHWLQKTGEEYDRLWQQPKLKDRERERLKVLLDDMFHRVLIKPEQMTDADFKKVKARLDDEQRADILTTFTVGPLQMAAQAAARVEAQQKAAETPEAETPDTSS